MEHNNADLWYKLLEKLNILCVDTIALTFTNFQKKHDGRIKDIVDTFITVQHSGVTIPYSSFQKIK